MSTAQVGKDEPILIELTELPGEEEVSLPSSGEMAEKAAEAFNNAMETIKYTAQRTVSVVRELPLSHRPDRIEVEFDIKIDMEANAWVAKTRGGGNIGVKFTWNASEGES